MRPRPEPRDRGELVPAGPEHRSFITTAQAETAQVSFGAPATEEQRETWQRSLERALSDPSSRILILRVEGSPVGYFWLEKREGSVAYLLDFYVTPAARRQAIGQRLLDAAKDQAADLGCRRLRLVVSRSNPPAEGFFQKRGALPIGTSSDGLRVEYELRVAPPPDAPERGER